MTCIGYHNISGQLIQQQTAWYVTEQGKNRTAIATSTPSLMLSNDTIEGRNSTLNATSSLIVLNMTSNFDGATVDCYFASIGVRGTVAGVFTLKIVHCKLEGVCVIMWGGGGGGGGRG